LSTLPHSQSQTLIGALGAKLIDAIAKVGDVGIFSARLFSWMFTRLPKRETLLPNFYQIGVRSVPVVAITGTFIGMVLAVQTYSQFRQMSLETRLGSVINISLVRELGPVLAATMLAGRVGSAMAAELGTMRVTEQIDALRALGANPIHYLVLPRYLACFLLIPLLTILADFMGVLGGWAFSVEYLGIDQHHYWTHARAYVGAFDLFAGVFKSVFFGAAIAIISCHRGFNCDAGAEGVGRAATEAFVYSFIAILVLDFFLGVFLSAVYQRLWPDTSTLVGWVTPAASALGLC
jgi:phospholipid/cholesterol/gamma-HCH transport system permease protein